MSEMRSIDNVRNDIEGISDDARFMAFMELYSLQDKIYDDEIERIINANDPILKMLFAKFLALVPEDRSVAYLQRLLCDPNAVVVNAACRAFEKNRYDLKLKSLVPVLKAATQAGQFFAIEKLAMGQFVDALDSLISLFDNANESLLLKLLSALRHFPDKRVADATQSYLQDIRDTVRFKAVIVFGSLHREGLWGTRTNIIRRLKDESPLVRKAALWALRQHPSIFDLSYIYKISENDSDIRVRQESLMELGSFPRKKVIFHLLKIMTSHVDHMLRLKAEGVLLSMPHKPLVKGLLKAMKGAEENSRNKARTLLAEISRDSKLYVRALIRELKITQSPKNKISCLEALGLSASPMVVPILELYVSQPMPLSYIALTALLRSGRLSISLMCQCLRNSEKNTLLKQAVLKYLATTKRIELFTPEILDCLVHLITDANINIRYLAVQSLIVSRHHESLKPLVATLVLEKDSQLIEIFRRNLEELFRIYPATLIDLFKTNQAYVDKLLSLLTNVTLDRADLMPLLESLFSSQLNLVKSDTVSYLMTFIAKEIDSEMITLEEAMHAMTDEQIAICLDAYLNILRTSNHLSNVLMPIKMFKKIFPSATSGLQKTIVGLVSFHKGDENISFLVELVHDNRYHFLMDDITKALTTTLEKAA